VNINIGRYVRTDLQLFHQTKVFSSMCRREVVPDVVQRVTIVSITSTASNPNKSSPTVDLATGIVETWAGIIRVETTALGVRRVQLPTWAVDASNRATAGSSGEIIVHGSKQAERVLWQGLAELVEYFSGGRKIFGVPLDPQGPSFFGRVWAQVRRVPYGETRSYQEIAQMLGAPKSTRAVGAANGANPVAPLVPCHRIVGSNGDLTGYGPGLPLKQRLLAMEDAVPVSSDEYDYRAWVERIALRLESPDWVLGLRRLRRFCAPGLAPVPLRDLPNRLFASEGEALASGYQKL
jgi:O-6-methylguanine DNA methyltransferase